MAYSRGVKLEDEVTAEIIEAATEIVHECGAEQITVRQILNKLGISNRVFYNRFKDINEVLNVIYERLVKKMHVTLDMIPMTEENYYDYLLEISVLVLRQTYDIKKEFSHYMFEHDSLSEENRRWWTTNVTKILEFGIKKGLLKSDLKIDVISFSIWCFFRGYNADVVDRKIPFEEAEAPFREGCKLIIDGMKPVKHQECTG